MTPLQPIYAGDIRLGIKKGRKLHAYFLKVEVKNSNFLPKDKYFRYLSFWTISMHLFVLTYNVQHGLWRTEEKET